MQRLEVPEREIAARRDLAVAINAIDPDEYLAVADSILSPIIDIEATLKSSEFTEAGKGTVLTSHRQAVELSPLNFAVRDAKDVLLFGGSVACLSLMRTPNSSAIMASLDSLGEQVVRTAINDSASELAFKEKRLVLDRDISFLEDKSEALASLWHRLDSFSQAFRLDREDDAALISGGQVFNLAIANLTR